MLHLTIFVSPATAGLEPECNEIASLLKRAAVDVRVYEHPVTYRPDGDFALVFADDLSWHHEVMRSRPDVQIDSSRFVVLRPPRDRALEIAEQHRVAAVVDYEGAAAWRTASQRGFVVRSDVASELPGKLDGALQSEHYASWWPGPQDTLASQLVMYLQAFLAKAPRDLTVIRAEDAKQRGLAAVTIRVDARGAGLIANPFPHDDVLLALSGPPGGVVSIVVANVKNASADLQQALRTSLGGWLGEPTAVGSADHAQIAGEDRTGVVFYTGAGFGRVGWFGCVVSKPGGPVAVAIGVSARSANPITAADIASNPSIAKALSTLDIA